MVSRCPARSDPKSRSGLYSRSSQTGIDWSAARELPQGVALLQDVLLGPRDLVGPVEGRLERAVVGDAALLEALRRDPGEVEAELRTDGEGRAKLEMVPVAQGGGGDLQPVREMTECLRGLDFDGSVGVHRVPLGAEWQYHRHHGTGDRPIRGCCRRSCDRRLRRGPFRHLCGLRRDLRGLCGAGLGGRRLSRRPG